MGEKIKKALKLNVGSESDALAWLMIASKAILWDDMTDSLPYVNLTGEWITGPILL